MAHHDALRLRFAQDARGAWLQENAGLESTVSLRQVDLSSLEEAPQRRALEEEAQRAQSSFRLEEAPLVRGVLFNLGPQRGSRLLLAIHHLVVDAVSWRMLLEDLELACQQLGQGNPVSLPPKTTLLPDLGAAPGGLRPAGRRWSKRPRTGWTQGSEVPALPVDGPGGANTQASARTVTVSLEAEETQLLLQELPAAWRARIDEVLLTALAQALSDLDRPAPVARAARGPWPRGALRGRGSVSRTVGWFTSTYPVTLELPEGGTRGDALRAVRDSLRRVPHKGLGYGLLRYLRRDEVGQRIQAQPEASGLLQLPGAARLGAPPPIRC